MAASGKPSKATDGLSVALRHAAAALQSGHAAEAERLAREVLLQRPSHRGARYLLGLALLALGRAEAAIEPLQAVAEGNTDPAVETNLGTALTQVGKHEEALAVLRLAATRVPPFAMAFLRLGMLLHMLERLSEAEEALRRAVTLAPHDAHGWVALGRVLADKGPLSEARSAFERALGEQPGLPDALYGLAQALVDEGDYGQAEGRFRELIARAPERTMARVELGFCLQELGRFDKAIEVYREAVAADPQLYWNALISLISASRGHFWHKPSVVAKIFGRSA